MYTSPRVVPPATIENSKVIDSIISQVGGVYVCVWCMNVRACVLVCKCVRTHV